MFCRIKKELEDSISMNSSDPFKDKVKCEECKHYIDKSDASSVKSVDMFGVNTDWYCPMHKKPYSSYISATPENLYYGEIRMKEDGTPVGYKKIT